MDAITKGRNYYMDAIAKTKQRLLAEIMEAAWTLDVLIVMEAHSPKQTRSAELMPSLQTQMREIINTCNLIQNQE